VSTELIGLVEKAIVAVRKSMAVIRDAQRYPSTVASEAKQGDHTFGLVTLTDKQSEQILHNELGGIPGTKFMGEEGTTSGEGDTTILVDPLDGTRPFALRLATSTVIVAAVRPRRGVVLCVIGEPSTGRIWSATEDTPTMLHIAEKPACSLKVWNGELTSPGSVFLDASSGFKRSGRQIMTDKQIHNLMVKLSQNARLLMTGSNGQHLALVANGSEYAAGQITTAVGGPWDIAGALLVERAGGYCRGFSIEAGALVEQNWRDIFKCDIMVSANSLKTVNRLVEFLLASL
jgi:fructose-1,6-bisphosphatase/inositol monophosphatase family enzyme